MPVTKSILLILFCSLLAGACTGRKTPHIAEIKEQPQPAEAPGPAGPITLTAEQAEAVGVKLGPVEERNLSKVVRANGYLRLPPQNIAQVSVLMGGLIKTILVKEEDYVRKGQVLAHMEHPDFTKLQESYLTTRTNLVFIEAEFLRQKELFQENVGAGKVFQQSEATYQTEKARLASLENQLRMVGIPVGELSKGRIVSQVPIRSPLAGYVSQINVNTGTSVQPGVVLFEVINNEHLRAELQVYETDLFKVKEGQKVSLVFTNQGNQTVQGEIFAVGKTFFSATKSVLVYADIPNKQGVGLIPGMYVSALIDVGGQRTEAVPAEAVVRSEGREYLFLLAGERREGGQTLLDFEMKEVKAGASEGGYVGITPVAGLPAHARVVTKGAFFVLAKSREGEGGDD